MCNILITIITISSFIIIIVMMLSIAFIINEDIIIRGTDMRTDKRDNSVQLKKL